MQYSFNFDNYARSANKSLKVDITAEGIADEVLNLVKPFYLQLNDYKLISKLLHEKMDEGLSAKTNSKASVKMFPSYVTKLPSGKEVGKFLALDLGGSDYRVILVTLEKGKSPKIIEKTYAMPKDKMLGSGDKLFDYVAETIQDFLKTLEVDKLKLSLAFTFSFPCVQKGLSSAILVHWTKGFAASGVEGQDVAKILQAAIDKRGMTVKCVAVVNDTVGTLTSCALQDPKCAIGLIVDMGTNAAYIEDVKNVELFSSKESAKEVIINMEWGAFGDDGCLSKYVTDFDKQLDKESLRPGTQTYEKMISEMYLGELVRLVLVHLIKCKLLFKGKMPKMLTQPNSFEAKYIMETERDPPHLYYSTHYMLTEDLNIPVVEPDDDRIVRYVCQVVGARAAYLAGAGISCLLNRLKRPDVAVGIDGSLFKFHPKFPERMIDMIHQLRDSESYRFVLRLSEDGSGKGAAAIAAALSGRVAN